jgi:hypothetical protein
MDQTAQCLLDSVADVAVGQAAGGGKLLPLQLAGHVIKEHRLLFSRQRMAACSIMTRWRGLRRSIGRHSWRGTGLSRRPR